MAPPLPSPVTEPFTSKRYSSGRKRYSSVTCEPAFSASKRNGFGPCPAFTRIPGASGLGWKSQSSSETVSPLGRTRRWRRNASPGVTSCADLPESPGANDWYCTSSAETRRAPFELKPRRYRGDVTQTTRPVSTDARTAGRLDGRGVSAGRACVESALCRLSDSPTVRPPAGFLVGQMSDGATATIIMSTNAISRLRLSTATPGVSLPCHGTGSYPPAWNG